jgi:hypothetical protein
MHLKEVFLILKKRNHESKIYRGGRNRDRFKTLVEVMECAF